MRQGHDLAIMAFAERFRPLLVRQARRLSSLDPDDQADVVMVVVERSAATLCRNDLTIPRSLAAYLVGALRNELISLHRIMERRRLAHEHAADDNGLGQEVVLSTCSESAIRDACGPLSEPLALPAAIARLAAVLAADLTDEERLLLLWERDRVPKPLIARWIGASYEATKQRIRRLRLRLWDTARRHASQTTGAERREVLRFLRLDASALRMAIARRGPAPGLLHHSDRGTQYASDDFQRLLAAHGMQASMSKKGDCWDNAVAESFFSTLELELIDGARWATHAAARRAIFEFIETWYNRERRHSTLGYRSPAAYEREVLRAAA